MSNGSIKNHEGRIPHWPPESHSDLADTGEHRALSLAAPPPPPPRHIPLDQCAIFLDVDGTLLEFRERPSDVRADAQLIQLLRVLTRRCHGATALISGRAIVDLDHIMSPDRFPASGMHGFERRNASGAYVHRQQPQPSALEEIRETLRGLVASHPRLLLEDKGFALAVHFRQAPELEDTVRGTIDALGNLRAEGLRVQHGHLVVEVTPTGVSKASALVEFMREVPFKGRLPLYIGDDLTDEPAFKWANMVGGWSLAVKPRAATAARFSLSSVAEVRTWLRSLVEDSA